MNKKHTITVKPTTNAKVYIPHLKIEKSYDNNCQHSRPTIQ